MSQVNQGKVVISYSIALQTDKPLSTYSEMGKRVEQLGFDGISVYNDLLYQPAWPALFEIARATSTISLGPAAVNPFTSHPVNIAGYSALLDEASGGRSYLGLARGAWLDFLGIDHPKPLTALDEALRCISHLHNQDERPLEAESFPLGGGDSLRWNLVRNRIPKLLGSWGLRTLERCYPHINEVKLGGSANPDMARHFVQERDRIMHQAGYEHQVGVVVGAVTVVDEDGDKARELAKEEVALYLPVVASLDPTVDIPEDVVHDIRREAGRRDYSAAAEHICDSLLRPFALAGTPEELAEQCRELARAGVSRIEFGTPHGREAGHGIELLGTKVLKAVKG